MTGRLATIEAGLHEGAVVRGLVPEVALVVLPGLERLRNPLVAFHPTWTRVLSSERCWRDDMWLPCTARMEVSYPAVLLWETKASHGYV